jgi:hypothetical protein
MQKIFSVVIALGLLLVLQVTSYAAPAVDGFIGVPWGASRQQVQKAMEERGFALLEQRPDGTYDVYQGTFAGNPAQLSFSYEKNFFYRGEAAFLHVKDRDYYTVKAYYAELRELITAKYGRPVEINALGSNPISYSKWEDLPTTAEPPGKVTIMLRDGPNMFRAGNASHSAYSVIVSYDIGTSWVRQLAVKDVKDI